MNSIFVLAFEYMKIGAVAIGGGYTVIPFLYYLVEKYQWFDVAEITQMVAVSNLTPGPIGINMATYVGAKLGSSFFESALGGLLATFAFMLPSFIIICLLAKFLKKNGENQCINNIMYGLRPAAVALITVAGLKILKVACLDVNTFIATHNFFDLISVKSLILLAVFIELGLKLKKNPMLLIAIAIVVGLVVKL